MLPHFDDEVDSPSQTHDVTYANSIDDQLHALPSEAKTIQIMMASRARPTLVRRTQLAGRRATQHGSIDATCSYDVNAPTLDDFASCRQYSTADTTLPSGDGDAQRARPLTFPAGELDHKLEFLNSAGVDTHAFDLSHDSLPQDVEEVIPSTDVRDVFTSSGAWSPALDTITNLRFSLTPALERHSWLSDTVLSSQSGETRLPLAVHLASRFSFTPAAERTSWITAPPSSPPLRASAEGTRSFPRPPLCSRFSFTPATERMSWIARSPAHSPGSNSSALLDSEGAFPLTPLSMNAAASPFLVPPPSPQDLMASGTGDAALRSVGPPSTKSLLAASNAVLAPSTSACVPLALPDRPSSLRRDLLSIEVVVHRPAVVGSPAASATEVLRRQALVHITGVVAALACTAAVYPLALTVSIGAHRTAEHVLFPSLLLAEVLLLANLLRFHYRRIHANAELLGRKAATSPALYLTQPSFDSAFDVSVRGQQLSSHIPPGSPSNATLVDLPMAVSRRSLGDRTQGLSGRSTAHVRRGGK